jgi:hypothetical protein
MVSEPLDFIPLWLLFPVLCVTGLVAVEVGYRFGRWRHRQQSDEKETPVGAMVASILGLLGIMLAFTFSLAASRFDARRQVILEEANAIGTTYLRTRLLPEPEKTQSARLLREYVDVRISGVESKNIASTITRSEEMQALLWAQAVSASENTKSNTVLTGIYVQSLNETIDLHSKRVMVGTRSRIPGTIWFVLYSLSLLGMMAVGYQAGLSETRRSPAMVALVIGFAGVLFLIADLDRGWEGFLAVSQQALIDVQKNMDRARP